MARLQKESSDHQSFRLEEIACLKESIARDESRMNEIVSLLMNRDTLDRLQETDDLIYELNSIGVRVERDSIILAKLKAPSELTEEEKKLVPKPIGSNERNNIKY